MLHRVGRGIGVDVFGVLVNRHSAFAHAGVAGREAQQAGDGVQLAIAQGDELLGLTHAGAAEEHVRAVLPARQADEGRWNQADQAGGERGPDVPADRRASHEHDDAKDCRRDPDARKDERDRDVGEARAAPLTPERRAQQGSHQEIRGRQDEQGHGVKEDSLVLGGHWAS
jgi:hypothetical protein